MMTEETMTALETAESAFESEAYAEAGSAFATVLTEKIDQLGDDDLWKDVAWNAGLAHFLAGDLTESKKWFDYGQAAADDFTQAEIEEIHYALQALDQELDDALASMSTDTEADER
ncbi:hypothetical protein ACIRS1_07185 [Kitasatospora sp. NPDC101176]|uniref:hypothetical protein n=1 Tax=Kitasatospora sp. NPDC101176 TaxID=3364099 RepID=UPI00380A4C12